MRGATHTHLDYKHAAAFQTCCFLYHVRALFELPCYSSSSSARCLKQTGPWFSATDDVKIYSIFFSTNNVDYIPSITWVLYPLYVHVERWWVEEWMDEWICYSSCRQWLTHGRKRGGERRGGVHVLSQNNYGCIVCRTQLLIAALMIYLLFIITIKIHSSCEIEDFVETNLCKLCVILPFTGCVLIKDIGRRLPLELQQCTLYQGMIYARNTFGLLAFPPGVFFQSRVTRACPATTDLIVRVNVWATKQQHNNFVVACTL